MFVSKKKNKEKGNFYSKSVSFTDSNMFFKIFHQLKGIMNQNKILKNVFVNYKL